MSCVEAQPEDLFGDIRGSEWMAVGSGGPVFGTGQHTVSEIIELTESSFRALTMMVGLTSTMNYLSNFELHRFIVSRTTSLGRGSFSLAPIVSFGSSVGRWVSWRASGAI